MLDDLGVEDLLELVADEVVDCLRIELAGDRCLHAVDQRELRVPLPGFVHKACVLERDSQAACQGLEELLVGVAERVGAVDVLERDHSSRPPTHDERDEERRLDRLAR